jgi:sterol desaturase/sphingolipid hydroxylase (fatty acid hydroxylase superfamily)
MRIGEHEAQLIRGLVPLAAFGLGLALERVAPHARLRPEWRANLGLWLVDALVMAIVCGACGWAVADWAASAGVGVLNASAAPALVALPATLLALDAVSYAWHRANHELPLLWRFHRVHHADADFHVSTALRFHPGELLLALPVKLGVILLLGAPPLGVLVFEALFGIANVLEHGNFDLPRRLERVLAHAFITPALHRRHHSTQRAERDTNFGTILCVWDRLARTFLPDSSDSRFETGLPGLPATASRSLRAMLAAPLARAAARSEIR